MSKIKKRLFAGVIILFMLSNTVFTNNSLQVYAEESSNSAWSEDFSNIASWGNLFPTDSALSTVDEITTTDIFTNKEGVQFRLDKEAICLIGSDKNKTPSVQINKAVNIGQLVSFSFDWSESDGYSESINRLGVYYSFDGQTFVSFPLAEGEFFPNASNGANNTDESGKFTATIPAEQVNGTNLEIKISVEDDSIKTDRTGFILDNLNILQEDAAKDSEVNTSTTDSTLQEGSVPNGVSTDVDKSTNVSAEFANEVTGYDDSVVKTFVSFAGTGQMTSPTVYADLNVPNDFLNTAVALTHSTGAIPQISSTSSGVTSYSLGYKGFKEGEYYQIKCSTKLYGNLAMSFRMKGSNTGPKNFTLSYSTDGTNYTAVSDIISISTASTWQTFNISLPSEAYNVEKLTLRLTAGSVSINNSTLGSSGTNYLSELVISGNPVVSDQICGVAKASPEAGEVAMNQEITLSSATEGATIKYSFDGVNFNTYDPNNKPKFTQLPVTLSTYTEKEGLTKSVELRYNYAQVQVGQVKGTPNGGTVAINTSVNLSCETSGATVLYSTDNGSNWLIYSTPIVLSALPVTILAKAEREGYLPSAVTTLSFTEKLNLDYNIYFGQLHSHTSYSDGAGSCDDAFNYAKNSAQQIDFLAVTDHSNSLDNANAATLADGSASTEWVEGHNLAKQYTDSTFVGLYGFEMTWSNGLGHINTFNTGGFQSRTQSAYTTYSTALQNYYTELKKQPSSISQFNHPGTSFGDFSDFAYYDEEIDSQITLVEVGNGEGEIGSSGYFPSYEYYTRALDKGWHVAPTNNQDNHKGKWGDANTARTVILADSLTEDNIYDAMRNMRIYATEDNDLQIRYTLNNEIMGTTLSQDTVGDTVSLSVNLKDETDSEIGKVEVIVNGGLSAASETVSTAEKKVEFTLPSDYSYYYIKVTEPDGDIAVTAPVWVGEVEAAGISKFSTAETLPVSGESVKLSLDLYNNEAGALNIESIEYTVDDEVVHTADLATAGISTIASLATKNYSFDYTYDGVGATNINVIVKGNLGGTEKVYKDVLKLTYVDKSMVTNVVVDGTHYNDYVTGYYGGNMSNLTSIAAANNIKVSVVKDKITQDTLSSCSLLIIPAPAKKAGTANAGAYTASSFEDDFIALVKDYVDRGGDVIVCGIADYQDATTGQSSKEINKLLQAIGATTSINSDEMYDTDNNGGQAYRLYLTNFNKNTAYTSDIADTQTYSSYSGCSVALDSAAVADGRAVALVKGHDTTYSINTKDDAGNMSDSATVVSKGEVVALAQETLSSGANIFVAGNIFMSDFEVKAEIDNVWDVPYANRTIMDNILNANKVSVPVSSISDARKGTMGNVYAVEGYVTAGTSVEGNTFFDTIYLQDATGGIDIFPISTSGIAIGTKMRIVGSLDQYQGDTELRVITSEILNDQPNVITPKEVSTKDASNYDLYGGMLVKINGIVTEVQKENGSVSQIIVKDNSGESAKVFIDGYIYSALTGQNTLANSIKKGDSISAIGILYNHPEGNSNTPVTVLRVRNCDEIVITGSTEIEPETPTYIVSFQSQGGSNVPSQTIKQGEKVIQPVIPAKAGYTFNGWYKEESCSNIWNFDFNTVTNEAILYAKWTENKVTQITLANTSLSLGKGEAYSMQITMAPKDALNQSVSWSSSDAGIAKVDSNGTITGVKYGTVIITAKAADGSNVEANCNVRVGYSITYKLNKGTNNEANPSSFYKEKISLQDPSRTGYTFKGWYTDKKFKTKISSISKSTKKNVTVYAKWEKIKVDKASIKSLSKAKTDKFVVKLDKVNKAKGYEIVYATNKNFTQDSNTITTTNTNKTVTGLQKGKTYYVKVRAYKMDSTDKKVYGKYSKVKKVVIK